LERPPDVYFPMVSETLGKVLGFANLQHLRLNYNWLEDEAITEYLTPSTWCLVQRLSRQVLELKQVGMGGCRLDCLVKGIEEQPIPANIGYL
jgi:hypothetical protein